MVMEKAYKDLTIKDDFMFCKIMSEYEPFCKTLTEAILDRKISRIVKGPYRQQNIDVLPDRKAIRFDVAFTDDENNVYDIEMQTTANADLAKRSRYYQSALDVFETSKGTRYKNIPNTYIIFICDFDFMGDGLPRYTFHTRCDENNKLLNDGSTRVFVCSTGEGKGSVSEDLSAFLSYMNGEIKENDFIMELNQAIVKAKTYEPWELEYMSVVAREQDIRMESEAKGFKLGEKLGQDQARIDLFVELLKQGYSAQQVASLFKLSADEFQRVSQWRPA